MTGPDPTAVFGRRTRHRILTLSTSFPKMLWRCWRHTINDNKEFIVLKKTVASLVIGGALLGGAAASAGTAYAATATPSVSATSQASNHPLRSWLHANRKEIRKAAIAVSAQTIGVTPKDLVSELRSGKSMAGVAAEHGVSAQAVINALVGAADTKINQAVADHRLTSAQANKIEAALPGRVTKLVNRTF
jgi:hypothetical protein